MTLREQKKPGCWKQRKKLCRYNSFNLLNWKRYNEIRLFQAKVYKEKGTCFFNQGKYELASNKYRKVVEFLEHEWGLTGDIEAVRKDLLISGMLNLALCLLRQNMWVEARNMCSKVSWLVKGTWLGKMIKGCKFNSPACKQFFNLNLSKSAVTI